MALLSVGEMVIDFLPGPTPDVYIRKAGGAPANAAIAVSRQGQPAAFCGMLGNDDFGRFLKQTLIDNGVTPLVSHMTDDAVTTMAFVSLTPEGERSFTFARKPGADMLLRREDVADVFFDDATIVHAGSCSLSREPASDATAYAMARGHELGKLVSFDVNYRDLLWDGHAGLAARAVQKALPWVDLLKISEEELFVIGGRENLKATLERCDIALAVLTRGADGAECFFQNEVYRQPAIPADCVDATGAGDAFWGSFLATLLHAGVRSTRELTPALVKNAMRRGAIAGSLCVRRRGAVESLPTLAELEQFEKEAKA